MSSPRYLATPPTPTSGASEKCHGEFGTRDRAARPVVDLDRGVARLGPLGVGQLARLTDPTDCEAVRGEDPFELVRVGHGRGEVDDDPPQVLVVRHPRGHVGEARVVGEVSATHRRDEEVERAALGGVAAHDQRLAVGDLHHDVVAGSERTDPLRVDVAVPQRIVEVLVDVEHRLGHRHVDQLPTPGALALEQRGDDRRTRLHARVDVGVAVRVLGEFVRCGPNPARR